MTSYDATYAKYFGPKITQFTKETTEEEIKELYKDWATDYNKVDYLYLIKCFLTVDGNLNSDSHAQASIKREMGEGVVGKMFTDGFSFFTAIGVADGVYVSITATFNTMTLES